MVNSACPMNEDYNTAVPMRRAMFFHLYKTVIVRFVKGVCNIPTVAMATVQCSKKTLETQFFKNGLKTNSVTHCFFSIFENVTLSHSLV